MRVEWRAGATVGVLAGLAILAGGCGGSGKAATATSAPSAHSLGSVTTSSVSSTTASPQATLPTSPASLLTAATTDAQSEQWAHIEVSDRQGSQSASIVQDSGPAQGQQSIQVGDMTAKVIMVNGVAYIQGNSKAVTSYFGFPAADGPTLAGRWISLSPSDSGYDTVTAGVSLASVLQETGLTGSLTETGRSTRDGQAVIGIQGTASSSDSGGGVATLYVTAGARPLPVEFDTTSSQGTEQAVFTDWGRSASLSAPGGAVPFASIPSS